MHLLKNRLKDNFTQIPNDIIVSSLSNEAFRLLVYLYSKPNDWKIYQGNIAKEFHVSRQTINKWFGELKEKSFVCVEQKNIKGKFSYVYYLMDGTVSNIVDTVTVSSLTDTVSNGHGSNLTHTNTNPTNTNITNTDRDIPSIMRAQVEAIFDEYLKHFNDRDQQLLAKERKYVVSRLLMNVHPGVKNMQSYVTTTMNNELRRLDALAELPKGVMSGSKEFSEEDRKIAAINWAEVLNDEGDDECEQQQC